MTVLQFHPPLLAHRGASSLAPENTFAAFIKAKQLGCQWLEFDVMQAACGELVIFHDETLDRVTPTTGKVIDSTYAFLSTLDVGSWFAPQFAGERIPTLKEMIPFLLESGLSANIELKIEHGQDIERYVDALFKVLPPSFLMSPNILYSSFSHDTLIAFRKRAPRACIGLLLDAYVDNWACQVERIQAVALDVNHRALTTEWTHEIKNKDLSLLCYTVNRPARALELFSWGVDAVFTDKPQLIIAAITA